MERALPRRFFAPQFGAEWSLRAAYGAIFALGAILFWLSESRPSQLPVWLPWDFSWLEYLATALTLFWYLRGLALTRQERPSAWRSTAFLLGLAAIYAVLQTHFDYVAQHMFFLNRAQHVVMHHIGPFLIALGWPGGMIKRGMPAWARQIAENRSIAVAIRVLQQPLLAAFLFVGLFYFWLIPSIHFRAMIDVRIYALMNWSMVLDGLLFWYLVLDPRPKPPARVSYGARAALAVGVTPIVRVSSHDAHDATRILDCGAQGVMVPHVSTVAEAQAVVEACLYAPAGHRSAFGSGPALGYAAIGQAEVCRILNQETLLMGMIETPQAVDNAAAMAAVPGIDVLHIGASDLSTEMGIPGQYKHDRMRAAFETVAKAARAHGKAMGVGGVREDFEFQSWLFGIGVRYLTGGSDVGYILSAGRADVKRLRAVPLAAPVAALCAEHVKKKQ